jgi:hypothetical protein
MRGCSSDEVYDSLLNVSVAHAEHKVMSAGKRPSAFGDANMRTDGTDYVAKKRLLA